MSKDRANGRSRRLPATFRRFSRRCPAREGTVYGKFSWQGDPELLCALGLPRQRRWTDWSTVNATAPRVSDSNRAFEDDEVDRSSSLDDYCTALSVGGNTAQRIFAPVFQKERDGFGEACPRIFPRTTLPVRAGKFRAICDVPVAITLEDGSKFIVHKTPVSPTFSIVLERWLAAL